MPQHIAHEALFSCLKNTSREHPVTPQQIYVEALVFVATSACTAFYPSASINQSVTTSIY